MYVIMSLEILGIPKEAIIPRAIYSLIFSSLAIGCTINGFILGWYSHYKIHSKRILNS